MIYLKSNEFFINSDIPITTELREPQENFPEHYHTFEEIVIVSKGTGIHVINDIPMTLSKNYVCFVGKNDRHLFDNVNKLYLSNVLYQQDKFSSSVQLKDYLPNSNHGPVDWFIEDETAIRVNYIIERLNFETHSNTITSRAMSELLFQQLVVELWRGKINDTTFLSHDDKIIASIVYINKNSDKNINIELLAEQVALPARTLAKDIKRATGMNFSQYLHFIRAKNAMALLINTDKSVTDIAFDVGYSDSNYFSTKFKQAINKKPSDIRRKYGD
ncbi:helix-turn-helix domain-containing protein [Vibrio hannami]|uniref:helix-turn-helix domain-containing protein n=1 Tax=Vibrio hannami TaxID=2717094 RepID=UPI002410A666|nr:helix-turn-helix domain-containing protein [Vibrio hannami]MDG3084855.1 helix-turn-helix domain-containing protein [Vibrio hannami]